LIQVCLNGGRTPAEHSAVPITPEQIADAAFQALKAGAAAVHVHARDVHGEETLEARTCGKFVKAVRSRCPGMPISLTTGLWIAGDNSRRLDMIREWTVLPDCASVNFSEEGFRPLCDLLQARAVGIEAGLATTQDAHRFATSGIACVRALIEVEGDRASALDLANDIECVLNDAGIRIPRLYHGYVDATWDVISTALARGCDVRIGFEDSLHLPDGRAARDNAELVAAAVALQERTRRALGDFRTFRADIDGGRK
jgi:uncharacterized protein (DUF849 family)